MYIALGLVFITSNIRMTMNKELRRMVKKTILEFFELRFRRSTAAGHSGHSGNSEPRLRIVGRFAFTYM
jgi:hypothetical protein